jgi:hypothetical protein
VIRFGVSALGGLRLGNIIGGVLFEKSQLGALTIGVSSLSFLVI